MTERRLRDQGFALLIVLWTLGLLAFFGIQLAAAGRQDAEAALNVADSARLEAAVEGSIQRAMFALLDTSPQHWNPDGLVHTVRTTAGVVDIQIQDEALKLNLNFATLAQLEALLEQVGVDPRSALTLAGVIIAGRTPTVASRSTLGTSSGVPLGGRPYDSLDELAALPGLTPELFRPLRPYVTVLTDDLDSAVAASGLEGASAIVMITAAGWTPAGSHSAVSTVVRLNAATRGERTEVIARERGVFDHPCPRFTSCILGIVK
ncbi:MAG: general secretion pathway protein GspK [Acetobacteraceae bacterium]|nr:general secretion pathway protein GspK [Acetobacteraceae bacterium]